MRYQSVAVFALVATAAACGWRRTPVPVISETGSVEALVGDWSGEYSSEETGRSGSIMFQLASAKDTAYGDVIMVARAPHGPMVTGSEHGAVPMAPVQKSSEPLTIRFVRMTGGAVSGTLAPYTDPECGCRVITTFSGRFADAYTIEGTYDTRGTSFGHTPSGGKWKVTRQTSTHTDSPRQ